MAYDEQEKELMAALQTLVAGFGNYDPPRLRKDGDIVIPLDAILKRTVKQIAILPRPLAS